MKTILFLMLPFPSHIIPTFTFAKEWQKKGYRVVFTGTENLQDLVVDEGFEFHEFQYISEYNISSVLAFCGLLLKTYADKSFLKQRYREFYSSQLAIESLALTYQPTHVYIDEHFAEYYFFFKKFDTTISIINTKLSTQYSKGIPPLNSTFEPNGTWYSNIVCDLLWMKHLLRNRSQELLQKIAFGGADEIYFWKRFCYKHQWDWANEVAFNHSFYRSVKTIQTIILSPKRLEFGFKKESTNEVYFHKPLRRNEVKYMTESYKKVIDEIELKKCTEGFKVVYCAFGTLSEMESGDVITFFTKLKNSLIKEEKLLLVISKGNLELPFDSHENLRVFQYIPQIDFLQCTDVMITHGGLGSVKECLDANVPMYVIPLNQKTDQNGNAVRINANGVGIKGVLKKESEEQIRDKIFQLINRKQSEFTRDLSQLQSP
jgi:zeaxanthin glucosyltransferase